MYRKKIKDGTEFSYAPFQLCLFWVDSLFISIVDFLIEILVHYL